jgi:hypothetical protein
LRAAEPEPKEEAMSTTGRDWGVTASQEITRCIETFATARQADLTPIEVLRTCWVAYQAARAAVGALVESQLREGADLPAIARQLGFDDVAQAQRALAPLRAEADARLHLRLHDA